MQDECQPWETRPLGSSNLLNKLELNLRSLETKFRKDSALSHTLLPPVHLPPLSRDKPRSRNLRNKENVTVSERRPKLEAKPCLMQLEEQWRFGRVSKRQLHQLIFGRSKDTA